MHSSNSLKFFIETSNSCPEIHFCYMTGNPDFCSYSVYAAIPSVCGLVVWWLGRWLATREVATSTPSRAAVRYLRQVVHTHVPLSSSSIIWYQSWAAMSCDWEGNGRSGIALVMRHRLVVYPTMVSREMSTSPTLLMGCGIF